MNGGALAQDHHHHTHHHDSAPKEFGRAFAVATALNLALVAGQIIYGLNANSLALLADAGHNFGDVMGLFLAWGAFAVANWRPNDRFTYRLHAASILSAFANGLILLVATGVIVWEAVQRFTEPQPVASGTVLVVAVCAVLVNGTSAWILSHGNDLNTRGAFLHMIADGAVSVAVIISALGIMLTGWQWLDPAVSLLISAAILFGTWNLLCEALRLSLNAAPRSIDPAAVCRYLESLPEVSELHDVHIWAMSTTENALTCHVVTPAGHPGDAFLHRIADELKHKFGIGHTTIQIELDHSGACALRSDHVV